MGVKYVTTFYDYTIEAKKFAAYEDKLYPYFALVEEVGEFMGKCAKQRRGDRYITKEEKQKELGDILWQLAAVIREEGFTFESIANQNLQKLHDRQLRGVIKGEGDER